jgi:excisionase family DNA binding protein
MFGFSAGQEPDLEALEMTVSEVARHEPAVEPLVVRPREACKMLSIGRTRLYELLRDGEIESYRHGRSRRIPIASIRRFIGRQIEDAPSTWDRQNHGGQRSQVTEAGFATRHTHRRRNRTRRSRAPC